MSNRKLTRRGFLAAAAGLAGGTTGMGPGGGDRPPTPPVPLRAQPSGLPARQHAWAATLATDEHGNPIAPRFDRLLFFDVLAAPSAAACGRSRRRCGRSSGPILGGLTGLLFTAGWGPHYFEHVLGVADRGTEAEGALRLRAADLRRVRPLPPPRLRRRATAHRRRALARPRSRDPGAGSTDLSGILRWRETRTGFVGAGLPAAHQDMNGIPPGRPVPKTSPLFMGFKSGFKKNQASEDDVTIAAGAFAGGTTMQVS